MSNLRKFTKELIDKELEIYNPLYRIKIDLSHPFEEFKKGSKKMDGNIKKTHSKLIDLGFDLFTWNKNYMGWYKHIYYYDSEDLKEIRTVLDEMIMTFNKYLHFWFDFNILNYEKASVSKVTPISDIELTFPNEQEEIQLRWRDEK